MSEPLGPSPLWPGLVGLLLAARYLQPTEGAVFGQTLWLAQLWLAAAAAWGWFAVKSGRGLFRWSLLDGFVWLLVLGHGLSMIPVFVEGGDRRAAVNVFWEWMGLGATVFLVRQVLGADGLKRALIAFAAVMVAIAAMGVWQHHVTFPGVSARYYLLRAEERELSAGNGAASHRVRLAAIRAELEALGVPEDPASARRWQDRLTSSSEPFGTFALANTLGGLLAAAVAVVGGLFRGLRRTESATQLEGVLLPPTCRPALGMGFIVLLTALGLVLYCLILTKSRTAWVGLAAGGFAAGVMHLGRGRFSARAVAMTALAAGGIVVFGLLVLATGGIDAAVFQEAPKSLRFRLDYWAGALAVLSERPLLGTGAGNFRSYYLEHRVEGASEAIAAPHNLFLDVWAAGGLLSLVALVGLLAYAGFRCAEARVSGTALGDAAGDASRSAESLVRGRNAPGRAGSVDDGHWGSVEWGVVAAFPVAVVVVLLSGLGIDWRLIAIWPVAAVALFVLRCSNDSGSLVVASGAGFCALAVHLLGADGIEFPAVVQTLLLLALPADRAREVSPALLKGFGVPGAFALLAAACVLTGLRPVLNGGALTARAEVLIAQGDPGADRALVEAAEADPLAAGPPNMRAEVATVRALATGSAADFAAAERRWREVLAAHPRDVYARRRLAELLLARAAGADDSSNAEAAAELLADAARLSPTEAGIYLELARAAMKARRTDDARAAAEEALRLDEVNRQAGHADLVFEVTVRDELARLAAAGNGGSVP